MVYITTSKRLAVTLYKLFVFIHFINLCFFLHLNRRKKNILLLFNFLERKGKTNTTQIHKYLLRSTIILRNSKCFHIHFSPILILLSSLIKYFRAKLVNTILNLQYVLYTHLPYHNDSIIVKTDAHRKTHEERKQEGKGRKTSLTTFYLSLYL